MKPTRGGRRKERLATTAWETRILLGLAGVLMATILLNDWGVFTPDTKPEIYAQPAETAYRYAQSWLDSPGLGAANYNTGVAPLAAALAVLDSLGLPTWLVMRFWRFVLLVVGALGARMLFKQLAGDTVSGLALAAGGVAAAVAYTANPYVVVGGGTAPTLQPYALLPWLVVVWLKAFRSGSWRWAVLAGLVLAAMGGLNAGVVPLMQLIVVIPLVFHAVLWERVRFIRVVWVLSCSALVFLGLSAYWLVPALNAMGAATAHADGTEGLAVINSANAYPEILRGLGMWTLYGADGSGPFNPNHLVFMTVPLVVVMSFGGPILAAVGVLLSKSSARLIAAATVLMASLLMIGTFPDADRTMWGRVLGTSIDNVPGMVAFRTTNKAGAVLELGIAILVGLAVASLVPLLMHAWQRAAAVVLAAAVVAGSAAPAVVGGLFPIRMNLPDYWQAAGASVDDRGGSSRVLMVPGSGAPHYAWGYRSPDEIGPSLFTRPFVFRSFFPRSGPHGGVLMAEVDRRLRLGTLPPGTLSTMARYVGASDVVGRYGLLSDDVDAGAIEAQLHADAGLGAQEMFSDTDDTAFVSARRVTGVGDGPPVRLSSARGALIVDGSGSALPGLVRTGLTEGQPAMLFSATLSDEALASALADGGRVVMTDSNQRREWSTTQGAAVGPLLAKDEAVSSENVLFGPHAQTTARIEGNAWVETRGQDWEFGLYPYGGIEQAFDGDPSTAWLFGHFGSADGHAAIIHFEEPTRMPLISLTPYQRSETRIVRALVTTHLSDRVDEQEVLFPEWNSSPTLLELPQEPIDGLEIEVLEVAGDGNFAVGFSEIALPGLEIERRVELPVDLALRVGEAAAGAGIETSDIPISVILERSRGSSHLTDEERSLSRDFHLPDSRSFEVSGAFRIAPGTADSRIDRMFGAVGPVRAESSSRHMRSPEFRASSAVDGSDSVPNLETAWSPDDPVVGEWIAVDFPEQELQSFTLTQNEDEGLVSAVWVSVNDGEPFEVRLNPGTTVIDLPEPTLAERVRILIAERADAAQVRIKDLGLPRTSSPRRPMTCVTAAWLNATPIRVQLGQHREALLAGEAVPFERCEGPVGLHAGPQALRGAEDLVLDFLHLSSGKREEPLKEPRMTVLTYRTDYAELELGEACDPCWLSSGQSYDPRWRAAVDGEGLSTTVMDGFAAGWRVDADAGSVITMQFAPRAAAMWGWTISGVSLAVAGLALAIAEFDRRRPSRFRRLR